MNHSPSHHHPSYGKNPLMRIAVALVLQIFLSLMSMTAEADWQEAGVRMGIQAGPKHEYFHLYEAFAVYGLPWDWRTASGWGLAPQLETSAGALVGGNETGFIGSAGTGLVFNKPGNGIALEGGGNLNLLDRRQFGHQDFGSILLWGAYVGVMYHFANRLGVGYRIQHLSNNRILYPKTTPNPGVDMHMIGLSWSY
jgi:hypothetical protein